MRIAIMGASVRAAAFSALAAGYEVIAADLFADSDLVARCPATRIEPDADAFVDWLAEQDVDAWMFTGSWENYAPHVARMAELKPLLGNPAKTLEACKSATQLAGLFADNQVAFPEITSAPPSEAGWLTKSHATAGGLGVDDWVPGSEAPENCYWQRKIAGRSISAAYVAAAGEGKLLGVTEQLMNRKWTHSQPFHYAGSVGPFELPKVDVPSPRPSPGSGRGDLNAQLLHVGCVLAREVGLVGVFGVDFVLDDKGTAWVVDVNPRYTASMEVVERFAGVNMIAAHIAACTKDELPEPVSRSDQSFGKAYLFAKRNATFRGPPSLDIADIPHEGDAIQRGKPICTLLADGVDRAEVEQKLQEKARELEAYLFGDE
ncbi:ATP-grasp domain-containing protein [Aeoliella sp. SH292]|uniref:ATP-grasp domain-containing protein n=1 Tax=Aeoliella sp. SH292 TaxID=3454464 RepID=UPI003F9EB248